MVCHGTDGKGTGPAAKGLPHPPADLTHHFHRAPGDRDAYLFWRVSEGGQVEPFASMQSTMPAFKTVLSEDQRWDVLAYAHAQFHKGFMAITVTGEGTVIAVVPVAPR
jgi:mono/diheme cytochrome c family protein